MTIMSSIIVNPLRFIVAAFRSPADKAYKLRKHMRRGGHALFTDSAINVPVNNFTPETRIRKANDVCRINDFRLSQQMRYPMPQHAAGIYLHNADEKGIMRHGPDMQ
jgi:hypothetical protein